MNTINHLRRFLRYDPETGEFRWLPRVRKDFKTKRAFSSWNSRFAGKTAGTVRAGKYPCLFIRIGGVTYLADKIAWGFSTGEWPDHPIRHINGDRSDNRLSNLTGEHVSQKLLRGAVSRGNSSGHVGIAMQEHGSYRVQVRGKHVGNFRELDRAIQAREDAVNEYLKEREQNG